MGTQEPLEGLGGLDFSRLRVDYGLTNTLSLGVNYNFTLEEMNAARFSEAHVPEALKTAFHEIVHLYQMVGTSYGYYCQLLRDFQSNQVIAIVRGIRARYGTGPRIPIARQVVSLPTESAADDIRAALRAWYMAELMLLWFEGDSDAFASAAMRWFELFGFRPLSVIFEELNWWLTKFVTDSHRAALPEPEPGIWLANIPQDVRRNSVRENSSVMLKMSADLDGAAVLESAARAAQYWGQHGPVPPELMFGELIESEDIRYSFLLQLASERLPNRDVHSFALMYGIIADIALNTPILPHHTAVRAEGTQLTDLNPAWRMVTALQHAGELAPMRDLSTAEYERFARELCDACSWDTPAELGRRVLRLAPNAEPDLTTQLYLYSLNLRRTHPQIFNDLSIWYVPKSQLTSKFTYYFSHPIMQFTDTVRLHNDTLLVSFFVQNYMLRSYLRRVLLSQDPTVTLPYAADDEEVSTWAGVLTELLTSIGFNRPRVSVRSGPIRPPHRS